MPDIDVTYRNAGGRLHTVNFTTTDLQVDRGASVLTGPTAANPITNVTVTGNLQTAPIVENQRLWYMSGRELNETSLKLNVDTFQQFKDYIAAWQSNGNGTDTTLEAQMNEFISKNEIKNGALRDAMLAHLSVDVEQEYSASRGQLSSMFFNQDSRFGPERVMFPKGYGEVANVVAKDLRIYYNAPVSMVNYTDTSIRVNATRGFVNASFVIVTVPLGILKAEVIEFVPEMPENKLAAIKNMGWGHHEKVVMMFDKAFWPEEMTWFHNIVPLGTSDMCSTWFNLGRYLTKSILVCNNVGKTAEEAAAMSDVMLTNGALTALRNMFGVRVRGAWQPAVLCMLPTLSLEALYPATRAGRCLSLNTACTQSTLITCRPKANLAWVASSH